MLGYEPPSPEAARKFLYQFHDQEKIAAAQQQQLELQRASIIPGESEALAGRAAVNRDLGGELGRRCADQKIATVDLDATIIESHKCQAQLTYQGTKGYQPQLALWAEMDVETRRLAARCLYASDWDDVAARAEADAAIATALRFRAAAVRRLPLPKRVEYLTRVVRLDDSLATGLLRALHLSERRRMLGAFLDTLGIPQNDGVIWRHLVLFLSEESAEEENEMTPDDEPEPVLEPGE